MWDWRPPCRCLHRWTIAKYPVADVSRDRFADLDEHDDRRPASALFLQLWQLQANVSHDGVAVRVAELDHATHVRPQRGVEHGELKAVVNDQGADLGVSNSTRPVVSHCPRVRATSTSG